MIHILIADDHAMIRAGLRILVSGYIAHAVIDEATDGEHVFLKCREQDYDIIILDINMPQTDSFGLVSNLLALKPALKILMYSMNAEEVYAKKFLQLGVKGFLSRTSTEEEIKKALDMVLKGNRYISPSLYRSLSEEALGDRAGNPFDTLSPREFEIVVHLIRGASLSEICQTISLQPSTVGTHKARIFEKLKCNNVIDLNALAKVYHVIPAG